jgi:hypothetical protein
MAYLLVLQQVLQLRVGLDALQLIGDNLPHLSTDAVVVLLNHLLHTVVAVGIGEVRDDGDRLVSLFLAFHLLGIHHYLTMKNLLLDALIEVVRHRADEHALRERGNLARRDKALHLRVDGGGLVLAVDGDALPLLQDFAETLRKGLGGLADHLTGEDVAHYSLNTFSEIQFYKLSLYISYLQIFSFGLHTHKISRV